MDDRGGDSFSYWLSSLRPFFRSCMFYYCYYFFIPLKLLPDSPSLRPFYLFLPTEFFFGCIGGAAPIHYFHSENYSRQPLPLISWERLWPSGRFPLGFQRFLWLPSTYFPWTHSFYPYHFHFSLGHFSLCLLCSPPPNCHSSPFFCY